MDNQNFSTEQHLAVAVVVQKGGFQPVAPCLLQWADTHPALGGLLRKRKNEIKYFKTGIPIERGKKLAKKWNSCDRKYHDPFSKNTRFLLC